MQAVCFSGVASSPTLPSLSCLGPRSSTWVAWTSPDRVISANRSVAQQFPCPALQRLSLRNAPADWGAAPSTFLSVLPSLAVLNLTGLDTRLDESYSSLSFPSFKVGLSSGQCCSCVGWVQLPCATFSSVADVEAVV
eukprot:scaffold79651_cov16-Tisochrysis_lutea.AAC.1